jgi:hypothetical protein
MQANLLGNTPFGVCIEQEPHIREMIDAYMGSKFKTVLELLERYSVSGVLLEPGDCSPHSCVRKDSSLPRYPPFSTRPEAYCTDSGPCTFVVFPTFPFN